MKALRENKALQLTTILQDYQLDDEDYNGYYNYYSRLIYTLTDENTMDGHLDSLRDYLGSKENYQY
ncbi:hypothetical protein STRIC_0671 [Streptococcus ictaluri 707-05]|uniref:Uncharacterized protein n=2 Tax=Streptococcus ictaluri TaxID=380397 RepID=G5JZG0_9STRE|nr:hypothetical protein STRIC_0671 [Streptococcus ictaluri 707-05]